MECTHHQMQQAFTLHSVLLFPPLRMADVVQAWLKGGSDVVQVWFKSGSRAEPEPDLNWT